MKKLKLYREFNNSRINELKEEPEDNRELSSNLTKSIDEIFADLETISYEITDTDRRLSCDFKFNENDNTIRMRIIYSDQDLEVIPGQEPEQRDLKALGFWKLNPDAIMAIEEIFSYLESCGWAKTRTERGWPHPIPNWQIKIKDEGDDEWYDETNLEDLEEREMISSEYILLRIDL